MRARLLDPVTDALRPVTGPLRDGVLAPVAGALRPVTEPVRSGVLTPVAGLLAPVTRPLAPVLAPVWRGLGPVREPLDPVLTPLTPVTDLLDPPADRATPPPPATPPPTGIPGAPGTPPHTGAGGPALDVAADGPGSRRGAGDPGEPGPHRSTVYRPAQATAATGPTAAGIERPRPVLPERERVPAAPVPAGSGSAGVAHGDTAVAGAAIWAPPALTDHRCRSADGPAPASRSTRPGTRPA
ncbi:hypothetical protein [Micromonospora fulviviridis]|uniref:Collagen-like protein n=1 Tax=Micromonospora fulviviridis TaxID=47860 RepID=A0ABV2VLB1_9ACTN